MTNKIIIAKDGFDVLTERNVDNQIFNSDYDTLKYHAFGEVVVTSDLADYYHSEPFIFDFIYYNRTVYTIAHGLGYAPHFRGYVSDVVNAQLPFYFADGVASTTWRMYADSTNLYIVVDFTTSANSGTVNNTFKYRIFRNRLGL